jgi:hypothetical protein
MEIGEENFSKESRRMTVEQLVIENLRTIF